MILETAIFYFFAAILLFAGLRVITARNPVHAALYLVLAFFTAAAIWLLLQAEFLAIALVVVYVGAVMVLFLFVIMMLDINVERLRQGFWRYLPLGLVVGILMAVEMVVVLRFVEVTGTSRELPANYSNTRELGEQIYTHYAYAFEIAAAVLLVAIVAAIALTLRRRKDSRYMDPAEQVKVRREDRVTMVSMPAEKDE